MKASGRDRDRGIAGGRGPQRSPARVAAVDVGSNSIRCIVAEAVRRGSYRILDDEKATVRLGEGVRSGGRITAAAWRRARTVLRRMRKIVDGLGVSAAEAVATSAVREAANGGRFVEAMAAETGFRIRVISGEEEALLAARSAFYHFPMDGGRFAVADLGGGSLEVASVVGKYVDEVATLDLGALALTERFLPRDPVREKDYVRLRRHLQRRLGGAFRGDGPAVPCVIGSGGTFTTLGAMVMQQRGERYGSVHGYEVRRSDVVHLLAVLRRLDVRARRTLPGLPPDRADIILAGVAVVDALLERLGANLLRVNEKGIREGLVLEQLARLGLLGTARATRGWRPAAQRFARACGVDEPHASHVGGLALALFDPLAKAHGLEARDRDLLEAAALLHDVGYFIAYPAHHKHSYQLIRHADLPGFSPREKELIANVARYHRRALPKKRHPSFAALAPEDRARVRRLAALLRLADGLDRRRTGQVRAVHAGLSGSGFLVRVEGVGDLSVERHGAETKGDLFKRAFGLALRLRFPRATALRRDAGGRP